MWHRSTLIYIDCWLLLGAFTLIISRPICRVKGKEGSSLFGMRGYYACTAASTETVRLFKHARLLEACRARRSTSRVVFWQSAVRLGCPWYEEQQYEGVSFLVVILCPSCDTALPTSLLCLTYLFSLGLLYSILIPTPHLVSPVHNTCRLLNFIFHFTPLWRFSYLVRSYIDHIWIFSVK
jgi:hypothetical protein